MLVLSRRPDQKIVFPNLDISVTVLQVRGKVVKLGVEAPDHVKVLRADVVDLHQSAKKALSRVPGLNPHEVRNRLNTLNLGLHLLKRQNAAGLYQQAQDTVDRLLAELQALDKQILVHHQRESAPASAANLLIIEDDDNERELLANLLRMHGFRVDTAEDGVAGLDYLATHAPPDFVLVDMKMPRIDGAQTVRQIRSDERFSSTRVFAVSGSNPQECGLTDGCDAWFPKPLDPQHLIQAMQTHTVAS